MTDLTFEQYWQYQASHNHGPQVVSAHPFVDVVVPVNQAGPDPSPWTGAVFGLLQAADVRQIAAAMPESEARSRLEISSGQAIEAILDDWCGTRTHPWPWPGPPPWVIAIVSELSERANTYQAGFLREELLRIAGQALQKISET